MAEKQASTESVNRALVQENEGYQKEIRRLIREIQGMSQTISWKITRPLRAAKRFAGRKRH